MRKRLFVLMLFAYPLIGSGQNASDTLAKNNVMFPLPTISLNVGFNHVFADVALNNGPSPFSQLGYQLTVTQKVTKFLNAGFEFYTGSFFGEEQRDLVNINFRTSMVSPRLSLEYNFYPLLKPKANGRQLIRPYVGFGIGMVFFRSKGDLKDNSGNSYQYWSNGGIYAEEEGTIDLTEATSLERDFVYETDLRDANLDGFRKYSQMAFTLPINAGIRFQLTKNFGLNAAFAYVLNVTDLIDNVNPESTGTRQGTSGFDNHLWGSVGVSVFMGRTKPSAEPERKFEEILAEQNEETSLDSAEPDSINQSKSAEISPYSIENTVEDPLATMSERLIKASASFEELKNESNELVTEANSQLKEIGERKFESKKDLKDAKKESIEILDKSIAKLSETNTELNETAGRLNMAYSDISSESISTNTSSTEKIESTVQTAIPAVESLKEKVKAAKSPEELRSLMNIASKNLSHTNDIFSEESQKMSSSISEARKTVVKKRAEMLLMNVSDMESLSTSNPEDVKIQLAQIETELQTLQRDGFLSEQEFSDLKEGLDKSLATIESVAQNQRLPDSEEGSSSVTTNQTELADAANLLASISKTISQSNDEAQKTLSKTSEQLSLIASKNINTNEDLKKAKEQAVEMLESSLTALNQTSNQISEAGEGISKASISLNNNDLYENLVTTEAISSSVGNTSNLVESSKSQIKNSKSAEEIKSILNLAASSIDRTLDVVERESTKINSSILDARKAVIQAKVEELTSAKEQPTEDSETDNELTIPLNQDVFQQELTTLKEAGLITNEEFSDISMALDENELALVNKKLAQKTISEDSKLKETPAKFESIASSVGEIHDNQSKALSEKKQTVQSIQNEMSSAKKKKDFKAVQTKLGLELESTVELLDETNRNLKAQLSELKSLQPENPENKLTSITARIQTFEKAIEENEASLEKLGVISVDVVNTLDKDKLSQAATAFETVLDESKTKSQEVIAKQNATGPEQLTIEVIETRIENVNQTENELGDNSINAITNLKEQILNEVNKLAQENILNDKDKGVYSNMLASDISESSGNDISHNNANSDNELITRTIQRDEKLQESIVAIDSFIRSTEKSTTTELEYLSISTKSIRAIQEKISESSSTEQFGSAQLEVINTLNLVQKSIESTQSALQNNLTELKSSISSMSKPDKEKFNETIQLIEDALAAEEQSELELTKVSTNVSEASDLDELSLRLESASAVISEYKNTNETTLQGVNDAMNRVNVETTSRRVDNFASISNEVTQPNNTQIVQLQDELKRDVLALSASKLISPSQESELLNKIAEVSINSELSAESNKASEAKSSNKAPSQIKTTRTNQRLRFDNIEDTKPKKTGDYHWADLNKNNWISPDEVLFFIDLLFEGQAERSVEDIQNLIDYYFDQE